MMLSTLLLLFGTGMWAPGMEAVDVQVFPEFSIAPIENSWEEQGKNPYFTAQSVLLVDENSMVDLYGYNEYLRLPMASLTKMMTALLIIENHSLDEIVVISKKASVTGGSTMDLVYGERITVQKLLQGLLMNSGNDAAIALAEYHSGTVYEFVNAMNSRAEQLLLHDTHFVNPHGLDSTIHYSSARDLVVIAQALWQYKEIQSIVGMQSTSVLSEVFTREEDGDIQKEHILNNTNKLLGSMYNVYGMKTGTTENAGQCLFLVVEKKGKFYFLVILGSEERYQDARNILYELFGDELL